jgi:hypothetical protein
VKLPDSEQFNFKDVTVAGDDCWLITPKDMSVKWTDDNARFRSCIVRKSDNTVVSQGFGKFTNFGEQPNFQPWEDSWPVKAVHKLDGSLLIVSQHNGKLVIRTRGTVDARLLTNGHEIEGLIARYPDVFDNNFLDNGYSVLLEWTSPTRIIVLREHDVPTLTLVGMIFNKTAQYVSQQSLDDLSKLWCVGRPKCYIYNTTRECILDVQNWIGKEGVVLYSPDGQTLKKIKASHYCHLHKIAAGICNVKSVMELFLASPRFICANDFYNYVVDTIDYEIAERIKPEIKTVVHAYNCYVQKREEMNNWANTLHAYNTRREQAYAITQKYDDWRKAHCFNILSEKQTDDTCAIFYELEQVKFEP